MTISSRKLVLFLQCLCLVALAVLVVDVVRAIQAKSRIPARRTTTAASPNEAGLRVPPEQLNFGEVYETSEFNLPLCIENLRDKEVEIAEFASSCNCTAVAPKSLTIPPGQKRTISLSLDLTSERNKVPAGKLHDFAVMIGPRLKDAPRDTSLGQWRIQGRVRTTIRFDRPVIDFGRNSEVSQPLPPQKARVSSDLPLRDLVATSDSSSLKVQVQRLPGATGQFELTIRPLELPRGEFTSKISLVPVSESGEELSAKWHPVKGRVVSDFQTSPPAVLLGARVVGEVAQESLALYSLSGQGFEVEKTSLEGEGLALDECGEKGIGDLNFAVNQKIAKPGHQDGRVVFLIRTNSGKRAELVVPVSYLGITLR
jgi:hypothetical protein